MPTVAEVNLQVRFADDIVGIISSFTLALFFGVCALYENFSVATPIEKMSHLVGLTPAEPGMQCWAMAGGYCGIGMFYVVLHWIFKEELGYELQMAKCYHPGRWAFGILAVVLTTCIVLLIFQNDCYWLVAIFCLQGMSALLGGLFYVSQLANALLGPLPPTPDEAAPQHVDSMATNVSEGYSGFEPKTVSTWFGFDRFCGVSALTRLFSSCQDSFTQWRTQHERAMQQEQGGAVDDEVPALVELMPTPAGPDFIWLNTSPMQMPVQSVIEGGKVLVGAGVKVVGFGVKVFAFSIHCVLKVLKVREILVAWCPKNWCPEAQEEEITLEVLWRRGLRVLAAAIDPRGHTQTCVWQMVQGRQCLQPCAFVLVLAVFPLTLLFRLYGAYTYGLRCYNAFRNNKPDTEDKSTLFEKINAVAGSSGAAAGVIAAAVVFAAFAAARRSAPRRVHPPSVVSGTSLVAASAATNPCPRM